jgi:hypothetical protein
MLGDLIYEAKGKTLGLRVLDDNGTMEMTIMENGVVCEPAFKVNVP